MDEHYSPEHDYDIKGLLTIDAFALCNIILAHSFHQTVI